MICLEGGRWIIHLELKIALGRSRAETLNKALPGGNPSIIVFSFIPVEKKKKEKEKKRFLVCFLCVLFQVVDEQTMKHMTNMKFGDVCHVISRPEGFRGREIKEEYTKRSARWKRFDQT